DIDPFEIAIRTAPSRFEEKAHRAGVGLRVDITLGREAPSDERPVLGRASWERSFVVRPRFDTEYGARCLGVLRGAGPTDFPHVGARAGERLDRGTHGGGDRR